MPTKKLKILMCSEASFISSGFGTYAKEILRRLHDTNKYEIAEFASYGRVNDPKDTSITWRYYANAVDDKDSRHGEYNSSMENQFGRWRFERVLLDFQPDIVFDIRDYWMNSYQQFSPLRPFYHWVLMPTVDSAPQQEEWIDTFLHADAIFTYSDFGRDTLAIQSNNKIRYIDTASPGVDLNTFNIIDDKKKLKASAGLPEDSFIIGSIMRNQKRKLIPDLFVSLKKFLEHLEKNNNPIGEKTYLYLHTSYPDAGWDIPQLLKEYKVGNRVLFTYSCKNCAYFAPCLFQHALTYCPRCGNKSFSLPNVSSGVPSSTLATIINLFDIYVQYAICEGFGMPQVEAAACGVPVASLDYSAMSDVVNKLNGFPVRVNQYFKELETQAIRAYPDNDHLVKILDEYSSLPNVLKDQKRFETRKLAERYYDWNNIAKKWEHYFDTLTLTGLQGKWNENLSTLELIQEPTTQMSPYDFITHSISKHMPQHQISSSIILLNMIQDLDYGFIINGMQTEQYNTSKAVGILNNIINNNNLAQNAKNNITKLGQEDFIQYAHMKENIK